MDGNNSTTSSFCLVCGYDLGEPISSAVAHDVICPSCGIQYGYSDRAGGDITKRQNIYNLWREAWIENEKNPLLKEQRKKVIAEALKSLE